MLTIMIEESFGPLPGAKEVAEYISRYRRSDLGLLDIDGAIDLFPENPELVGIRPRFTFKDGWRLGPHPGVYMVYSEAFDILYVGKASMGKNIGDRLWTYFGNGDKCVLKHDTWPKTPRFLVNIAVPDEMPFEAPALEEYLIGALKPPWNALGKRSRKSTIR